MEGEWMASTSWTRAWPIGRSTHEAGTIGTAARGARRGRGLLLLASAWLIGSVACEIGPQSGIGLRLPEGDPTRGARTFRDLGCPECHVVVGEPAPARPEGAPRPIALGGKADHIATHGELVTSIVNPSHGHPRRYPREEVFEQGLSKMKNFNDRMTVEQLLDLTTYLQSKYELDFGALYGP